MHVWKVNVVTNCLWNCLWNLVIIAECLESHSECCFGFVKISSVIR